MGACSTCSARPRRTSIPTRPRASPPARQSMRCRTPSASSRSLALARQRRDGRAGPLPRPAGLARHLQRVQRRRLRRDRRRAGRARGRAVQHGQVGGRAALVWERYPGAAAARRHRRPRDLAGSAARRDRDISAARTSTRSRTSTTTSAIDSGEEVTSDGGEFDVRDHAVRRQAAARGAPVLAGARAGRRGRRTGARTPSRPSTSRTASTTTCGPRRSASPTARSRAATGWSVQTHDGAATGPNSQHINNANM